jgi:hypothetical protein
VQFNSSGSFGGDAGFTYTTLGQVTIAGGTITTNNKALTITQTWNSGAVRFDAPLSMNITTTAADSSSALVDIQANGVSLFQIQNQFSGTFLNQSYWIISATGVIATPANQAFFIGGAPVAGSGVNSFGIPRWLSFSTNGTVGTLGIGGGTTLKFWYGSGDVPAASAAAALLYADASQAVNSQNIAIGNSVAATGLRIYNTTDSSGAANPTNYERGVFDWTTSANQLTIGSQNGGTGTGRPVILVSAGLYAAAGPALPTCAAGIKGAQAVVSDATAPTYNANYTSGGAVVAHVVCNGTNWVTQ